ncbi:MAG: hypothetical protein SFU87_19045 [Chitinophagaceae bacterium]|nr:hypothetical protein [Chitinophagaceae bacterium]
MKTNWINSFCLFTCSGILLIAFGSCQKEAINAEKNTPVSATETTTPGTAVVPESVFLLLDEDAIDNGNPPNNFSETDVNDHLARVGLRLALPYFRDKVGDTIELFSGEVGDEGWYALKTIPASWKNAGPASNGTRNFLQAGPGLGTGNDGPEILLDKIPYVTPLRAKGLAMLVGKPILAIVYDGDISNNYGPLTGNLQGTNLGVVALEVLKVSRRTDGSSSSLPRITIKILSVDDVSAASLRLFGNAPEPVSSSEPFDVTPPATIPPINLTDAP